MPSESLALYTMRVNTPTDVFPVLADRSIDVSPLVVST